MNCINFLNGSKIKIDNQDAKNTLRAMKVEFTKIEPRHMIATKAIHQLGDISSDAPDICRVYGETETDWIGAWVEGLGFFDVRFPKDSTRELTTEEVEFYRSQYYQINDNPSFKLDL